MTSRGPGLASGLAAARPAGPTSKATNRATRLGYAHRRLLLICAPGDGRNARGRKPDDKSDASKLFQCLEEVSRMLQRSPSIAAAYRAARDQVDGVWRAYI